MSDTLEIMELTSISPSDTLEIMELTSISPSDLEALTLLLITVADNGASIGFLPPVSRDEASAYWKNVIQPDVILWVAKFNNEICGTVQLHLAQKENALHRAAVAKLMVDPNKRRNGIGKALMHTLEKRAKLLGRNLLVLGTRSDDISNLLYQSLGYIKAGSIPGYAMSADGVTSGLSLYYKELQ
jgi:ribosomal protein S18 acetylase RimI-like enzyme